LLVDDILYAGSNGGVFRSKDALNWTPLNLGLEEKITYDLVYLPLLNRLYANTGDGICFQTLDIDQPIADSLTINLGAAYTRNQSVTLLFYVRNADSDSMLVSEDSTFKNTEWESFQVNRIFNLTNLDGPKNIYAKFKDISYNESKVINSQIILDMTKPMFHPHNSPSSATSGNTVTINQHITEANLDEMILYYHRGGEGWSENRRSIFQNGAAEIDGVFITDKGIDYRIVANDLPGNIDTLQNGSLDFFSIPVDVVENELDPSVGLPSGTGASAYRLVSLPLRMLENQPVSQAFTDLGEYGPKKDYLFWRYEGNENWSEGEQIPIQLGESYFLIKRNGGFLSNKSAGVTAKTTDAVLGEILGWLLRANDWNLIGNPFNFEIDLKVRHAG
jgi:hypothetical protein